jgi:prepilin-type processing-associated H-X9-DG protein
VGPGTAFPGGKSVSLEEFTDGPENTIVLVEIANSNIHWSEPRDLMFDEISFKINDPAKPSISSPHADGPNVVFADGRSCRVSEAIPPETLRALFTINGGEKVSRYDLKKQGFLH